MGDPIGLAVAWWETLASRCLRGDRIRPARGLGRRVHLWPATQVAHAGVMLEPVLDGARRREHGLQVDAAIRSLGWYRSGDAWGPRRGERPRYADDVAWLGLCLAELADTRHEGLPDEVHRALAFVRACEDPAGGIRWHENATSRHTCATAPGAHLAMRVAAGTADDELVAFARRSMTWLNEHLLRPDGRYGDHVGARVDDTVWAYNQGEAATAWRLLGRDPNPASEAAVRWLADPEVLWRQPQIFVGIGLRNLVRLDPTGTLRAAGLTHLARVAREAIGEDGFPLDGAAGRYGDDAAIDLAGMIQTAVACAGAGDPPV